MVHVPMRKQDDINRRELFDGEGRGDVTLWPGGAQPERNSDAIPKSGIGQNANAKKIDEDCRMPDPAKCDCIIRPGAWIWFEWCRSNRSTCISDYRAEPARGSPLGGRHPPRCSACDYTSPRERVLYKRPAIGPHAGKLQCRRQLSRAAASSSSANAQLPAYNCVTFNPFCFSNSTTPSLPTK